MNLRRPLCVLCWASALALSVLVLSVRGDDVAVYVADPKTPDEKVIEALSRRTDCDYSTVPLFAVADHIAVFNEIAVNLAPEIKKKDLSVTFKAKGIKLADALKAMLEPLELEYAVVSGTVLIRFKTP